MNCQQKSGVFLNMSCQNAKVHTCTSCKKEICEMHAHSFMRKHLCEDCYWEDYLYTISKESDTYIEDTYMDFPTTSQSSSSSSSSSSEELPSFDGGFGGGSFGGGGAAGSWTEGDMKSASDLSTNDSTMRGSDDTFFYS